MSLIKLANVGSGVSVISTAIDVPADGKIMSATMGVAMTDIIGPVNTDYVVAELSFLSSDTIGEGHDSRGSLMTASANIIGAEGQEFMVSSPLGMMFNVEIPVNAGERIFLHCKGSVLGMNWSTVAYIFIKDNIAARAIRRR